MDKTFKNARYVQSGPMHTAAGGQWCFARDTMSGADVFIKEYSSFRYPPPDADKSRPGVRAQEEKCDNYAAHMKRMNERINRIAHPDGNVVITTDFFREGVFLYKVTRRVELVNMAPADVHKRLTVEEIDQLMIDLLNAVSTLHAAGVLHCDLKPENVFIVRRGERYTAMIADYDDSFFMDAPPAAEKIVGTPEYFSPELGLYVVGAGTQDEPPAPLRAPSDIFALGLLYHQYLTGALPAFSGAYPQLWAALLSGERIRLHRSLSPGRRAVIDGMLQVEPEDRPQSCMRVAGLINDLRRGAREKNVQVPQGPTVLLDQTFDPPHGGFITRLVRYSDGMAEMTCVDGSVDRTAVWTLPLYGLREYM